MVNEERGRTLPLTLCDLCISQMHKVRTSEPESVIANNIREKHNNFQNIYLTLGRFLYVPITNRVYV